MKIVLPILLSSFPALAFAQGECPITEGSKVDSLTSSQDVAEIIATIPPTKDDFQTTEDFLSQVSKALGSLSEPSIIEVDEGDRSFISYNADKQRIEVGVHIFESYSSLDYDRYALIDYFDLSIDNFELYMSENFIVGLSEKDTKSNEYIGQTSLGASTTVEVIDKVNVSIHGGLFKDGTEFFQPDEVVNKEIIDGIFHDTPVFTIPMPVDVARVEMPVLRAVVATSGLSPDFLRTTGYIKPTIDRPREIRSTNFLFKTSVSCVGFIDTEGTVLKVAEVDAVRMDQ